MLVKVMKLGNLELESVNDYKFKDDSNISTWAKDSIYIAKRNGIISGTGRRLFKNKLSIKTSSPKASSALTTAQNGLLESSGDRVRAHFGLLTSTIMVVSTKIIEDNAVHGSGQNSEGVPRRLA